MFLPAVSQPNASNAACTCANLACHSTSRC
jgi:hypothetical protein